MAWSRCFALGVVLCVLASQAAGCSSRSIVLVDAAVDSLVRDAAGQETIDLGAHDDRAAPDLTPPCPDLAYLAQHGLQLGPVTVLEGSRGLALNDLILGGPGWLASGSKGNVEQGYEGAMWGSADGTSWRRFDRGEPFGNASPRGLAQGPGGVVVAVGFRAEQPEGAPWAHLVATAWRSADDGVTWTTIGGDRFGVGGLFSVVYGAGRYVAAGANGTPDQAEWTGMLWTSDDGIAWKRLDDPTFVATNGWQLIEHTSHGFIAAGYVRDVVTEGVVKPWIVRRCALFHSDDGLKWTRVSSDAAPAFPPSCAISGIAESTSGLVAVGSVRTGHRRQRLLPAVWLSTDGRTWTRQADPPQLPGDGDEGGEPPEGALEAVAADGALVVAAGKLGGLTGAHRPLVWLSLDGGATWDRDTRNDAALTADRQIDHASISCPTLVLAGSAGPNSDERDVWTASAPLAPGTP